MATFKYASNNVRKMAPGVVRRDARLAVKQTSSRGIKEGANYINNSDKGNITVCKAYVATARRSKAATLTASVISPSITC